MTGPQTAVNKIHLVRIAATDAVTKLLADTSHLLREQRK
jgi:hypothetical protein